MNERQFQRETVAALRKLGLTVWVTSTNRKSRNTVGCPDVFVAVGCGVCIPLEFKGDNTKETPRQREQSEQSLVYTFRPENDPVDVVFRIKKQLSKFLYGRE